MGLYKREQTFTIIAAVLFVVGAVFMFIYIFGTQMWALWVGLAFAIVSTALYVLIQIQHYRFKKKYTAKESEIKAVAEKEPKKV